MAKKNAPKPSKPDKPSSKSGRATVAPKKAEPAPKPKTTKLEKPQKTERIERPAEKGKPISRRVPIPDDPVALSAELERVRGERDRASSTLEKAAGGAAALE